MSSPIVLRIHPGPDCLSAWQLAELACGDEQPDADTRAHLASCTRCHDLLTEQQNEIAALGSPELPEALLPRPAQVRALPRRPRRIAQAVGGLVAMAACALIAVQWRPAAAPEPGNLAKGNVALSATVLRSDAFIAQDVPMQQVPVLQAGDRLRLHVLGAPAGAQVHLESRNNGQWETLYDAPLPADRWLPIGVKLDGASTTLKLRVCTSNNACDEHTFEL